MDLLTAFLTAFLTALLAATSPVDTQPLCPEIQGAFNFRINTETILAFPDKYVYMQHCMHHPGDNITQPLGQVHECLKYYVSSITSQVFS